MTNPTDEPRSLGALPTASCLRALTSRPVRAIAHPAWSEARETVMALVTAGPTMIVVLGPPGTGKAVLLRDLATRFGERGRLVCLLEFGDNPRDVGPAEIVLVDEADRMSATRLDELRSRGDLAIVLAALPASGERFAHYPDVTVVRLAPLSPNGARAFLEERLAQLGLPNGCLTEAAWARLIVHGHGVPRVLMALLRLALFIAGEEHAERVIDAHVEEAVAVQGDSAEASTVEPARAEAAIVPRRAPETPVKGEGIPAETTLDWTSEAPAHRWRNRVAATAFAAGYTVAVAALLIWGHRQMNQIAAPRSDSPAVVRATPAVGDGLAQVTRGSHPVSDALASMPPPPILVPKIETASTRPDVTSPAGAKSFQPQATTATQPAAVAIAIQPYGANVSPLAWVVDPHRRCSGGNWTWSSCGAHPRRVVWRRVRRCFIALGNLCLGESYHYVRDQVRASSGPS